MNEASGATTTASGQSATRFEVLSPQTHGQLRLRARTDVDPHFVQIVVEEFALAAAFCPVVFTKNSATGSFFAGALFGFKPGESLLESPARRGGFDPLILQRDGFFVHGQQIAIDRNNPRFSESEGQRLFDEALQPTAHLRHIQRILGRLHAGLARTDAFIQSLSGSKLIESIDVDLNFDRDEKIKLQGLYTVSMDALHTLGDAEILRLFRCGDLQAVHVMHGSLNHFAELAKQRHQRLAAQR